VRGVLDVLLGAGYQAFIVGGACRDLLDGLKPHDWDVATDATPPQVEACFAERFRLLKQGEKHGTIGVLSHDAQPWCVEVTTFRSETTYSDGRRPDSVQFVRTIEEDLSRRDFTVNALALRWPDMVVIDPFDGLGDLRRRLVRCVGDPQARFGEDGLRLLRAVRLRAERGWKIEKDTYNALGLQAKLLKKVSRERVRDEFARVMTGKFAAAALRDLVKTGLLVRCIPEFQESINFDQRTRHHRQKLDEHVIETVSWVPERLELKLAALLHDIAKPRTFTLDEDGQGHFYGHNKLGAEASAEILRRLRFSREVINRVTLLVKEHMFVYGPQVTDAGLRRLVGRVGRENIADLFELRRADIVASGGMPDPWLDKTWDRVAEVIEGRQPTSETDLAIDGNDIMQATGWEPGPRVGRALEMLLERVLQQPELNERRRLLAELEAIRGQVEIPTRETIKGQPETTTRSGDREG
jgi:putative nucleotidyltransferase with HDIG domain